MTIEMVSVTTVLKVFSDFGHIPENILETASERGIRVHSACACYLKRIYVPPLPKNYQGYFDSFVQWADMAIKEVFFIEERLEDLDLGFFGHPDMGVELWDGFEFRRPIIDIKTGQTDSPAWRAQTAAYQHLANKKYGPNFFDGHLALIPSPSGGMAKIKYYKNQVRDFTAFMSALNCHRYFK